MTSINAGAGVKRVKTGCITCRIRRVKCDEIRPRCLKCTNTGRACDGYSALPFSRRELQAAATSSNATELRRSASSLTNSASSVAIIGRLVADPAFGDVLEKRYFQFFREKTVQSTNSLVGSRFWDRVVLQFAHIESAVKHAVLALSALHQLSEYMDDSELKRQHLSYTEKQHEKALAALRNLVAVASSDDVDRILIACVIFIAYEGIRGDYRASRAHLTNGRLLLAEHKKSMQSSSRRLEIADIVRTLSRLDVPALTFQDRSVSSSLTLDEYYRSAPTFKVPDFDTMVEAQASLTELLRWSLSASLGVGEKMMPDDTPGVSRSYTESAKCSAQMYIWCSQFEDLVQREPDIAAPLPIAMLRMWHRSMLTFIEGGMSGPETRWDRFDANFAEVISQAEIIVRELRRTDGAASFSVEMGYLDPTFVTATRCRNPSLRRRALSVLQSLTRQEGIWQSSGAAAIALRWINVEEESVPSITCAADIPERLRIATVSTGVNVDAMSGHLILTLSDGTVREEHVSWDSQKSLKDMNLFSSTTTTISERPGRYIKTAVSDVESPPL